MPWRAWVRAASCPHAQWRPLCTAEVGGTSACIAHSECTPGGHHLCILSLLYFKRKIICRHSCYLPFLTDTLNLSHQVPKKNSIITTGNPVVIKIKIYCNLQEKTVKRNAYLFVTLLIRNAYNFCRVFTFHRTRYQGWQFEHSSKEETEDQSSKSTPLKNHSTMLHRQKFVKTHARKSSLPDAFYASVIGYY